MKGFLEDAKNIQARDPARPGLLSVFVLYPGFQALVFHRIAGWLWARGLRFPALVVSRVARDRTGVEIHPGAIIGRRVFIDHGMGTVIGETAVVEDDVVMMHGVTMGNRRAIPGKRHPTVRAGAFSGAGAVVLGGIEIGQGARVGAGAVVLEDVPAGETVAGNPGRLVKRKEYERHLGCHR